MTRELLGEIGVDTGNLFLIDPGYLSDAERWKKQLPKLKEGIQREKKAGNDHMVTNLTRLAKEKTELIDLEFNWHKFCEVFESKPKLAAGGIILPTHADGGYRVYAVKDSDGEIMKYEVIVG